MMKSRSVDDPAGAAGSVFASIGFGTLCALRRVIGNDQPPISAEPTDNQNQRRAADPPNSVVRHRVTDLSSARICRLRAPISVSNTGVSEGSPTKRPMTEPTSSDSG
jgi:hypothetical protein